jgi:branched-chain amino acid transport system substrate-binding protein
MEQSAMARTSAATIQSGSIGTSRAPSRRTVLAYTAAGAATAAFGLPAIAQSMPFKVGLLTVKTGPLAQGGNQMEQGIVTFLKEKNYTLAGRKIDFVSADTAGNPAGAKNKVQELIERDNVDIILGPLAAAELLAITDYVHEKQVPLISLAAADDVTQRHVNPFVVRPSASSSQCTHVLGDYAAKDLKYKTATTFASDFAFGYEQVGGFQRVFEDEGGRVAMKLWPPLVTPDYTPYIAQIQDVDCCMSGLETANPVKFMRSYQDLGLKAKIPLLGGWTAMDDALLPSLGDEAIGVVSAAWYSADYDTPSNKRFVADMKADFGVLPGGYSAGMYIAGQCLEAALQKAGGKVDSGKQLAELLHSLSLTDTPRGAFQFDQFGNVVGNVFIRKCERKNGQLVNTVIKSYPNVSQFWTFDVKWFLAQPVYSRDYPPLKHVG